MLHLSYEICGVILAVLLAGGGIAVVVVRRKLAFAGRLTSCVDEKKISAQHELEHRALVFLMTQKTDSVLAAISQTIEAERQKLGAFVMDPSINEAVETLEHQQTSLQVELAATQVRETPAQLQTAHVPAATSKPSEPAQASPLDRGKPSDIQTNGNPDRHATVPEADPPVSIYNQILPMAQAGMDVTTIADELQLPEAEVAMTIRLNAA
ncbi:hypothetical protein DSCO28_03800 [Desulfosarcina ovata subsp. sediminis]|uniref:DUF2802 domain-containing protein n=1 Tax=Desulfosarcina ovata subsp. sediminis TaxID=885957 RepID=A0A5K7ZEW9_9BACT|nr:hypothetical protein [Desulfosarcina ovata]BBO79814.1 hypothetical protein DSCO28_03800 [Desulfosarcina ovata subsp. sediminis]